MSSRRTMSCLRIGLGGRAVRRAVSLASALLLGIIGMMMSPSFATACSVCSAGRDEENAAAFLLSTIFMSLLPLVALGTLLYVIRRRYQKLEADMTAQRASESKVAASLPSPLSPLSPLSPH